MNMNATAVRKFCTLEEAAERLNTTPEQIENLVRKGMLHEFRDGSHRLLRTADVGAIVAARTRRLERQGQPLPRSATRPPSPQDSGRSASGPVSGVRLPRAPDATSQTSGRGAAHPKTTGGVRQPRNLSSRPPARRPASACSPELPSLSDSLRTSRGRTEPQALPARQSLSVREWFWTGLIQDRPAAIALLSGLVILILSALVAGVCILTDAL